MYLLKVSVRYFLGCAAVPPPDDLAVLPDPFAQRACFAISETLQQKCPERPVRKFMLG